MNVHDILKYGNRTVMVTIEGVAADSWDRPGVCGVWSCKEIMAHLASFEHLLVDILEAFPAVADGPTFEKLRGLGGQGFNDEEVGRRARLPWQEVITEYVTTQAQAAELARAFSPAEFGRFGTLPWYGEEYSLDDYVVYTFYGHKREHMAQINVFLDVLRDRSYGGRPW